MFIIITCLSESCGLNKMDAAVCLIQAVITLTNACTCIVNDITEICIDPLIDSDHGC